MVFTAQFSWHVHFVFQVFMSLDVVAMMRMAAKARNPIPAFCHLSKMAYPGSRGPGHCPCRLGVPARLLRRACMHGHSPKQNGLLPDLIQIVTADPIDFLQLHRFNHCELIQSRRFPPFRQAFFPWKELALRVRYPSVHSSNLAKATHENRRKKSV